VVDVELIGLSPRDRLRGLEIGRSRIVGDVPKAEKVEHHDLALDPAKKEVAARLLGGLEVCGSVRHAGSSMVR